MKKMSSNNSEDEKMKNSIEILNDIQPVDAPPFLFTRVMQKINNSKVEQMPTRFVWSMGLSLFFIFALNISVIAIKSKQQEVKNIASEMNLYTSNALYK